MKRNTQICIYLLALIFVTGLCSCKKTPEKTLYKKDGLWEMTFNISYKVIDEDWHDTIFRLDTIYIHQTYFDKDGTGYYTEKGKHLISCYEVVFENISLVYNDNAFTYFPTIGVTVIEFKKDYELWKCNSHADAPYTNNTYYLDATIELHRK